MQRLLPFLLFFSILFSGCSSSRHDGLVIGIDPSFSPVVLGGQADNVYGFTVDLLQAIAKVQRLKLKYEATGSESLFSGLELGNFQAVLSSLFPMNFETETYSESNPYFLTGPVLVVPFDSKLKSLDQFSSKIVGTLPNSEAYYIVQKYPYISISTFSSAPFLMEALSYGEIDGALISLLEAQSFVQNLYRKVFKVASKPLSNEGLRLITLKGDENHLIEQFNRGLQECKSRGIYQNLLLKWELN